MSFSEIKDSIPGLTSEERLELAALIAHLSQAHDPAYQAELDQRMNEMDSGKQVKATDFQHLHRGLSSRGQ